MESIERVPIIQAEQTFKIASESVLFRPVTRPQNNTLISEIERLIISNSQLQSKQQNLINNISDLRRLLQLTGKQSKEEIDYVHNQNAILSKKLSRYQSAMKHAQKEGNHLSKCAMFWNEFL